MNTRLSPKFALDLIELFNFFTVNSEHIERINLGFLFTFSKYVLTEVYSVKHQGWSYL